MPRVLNRVTGLEHDVPAGHFSLSEPERYDVLPDPDPEPTPAPAPKRKTTKK